MLCNTHDIVIILLKFSGLSALYSYSKNHTNCAQCFQTNWRIWHQCVFQQDLPNIWKSFTKVYSFTKGNFMYTYKYPYYWTNKVVWHTQGRNVSERFPESAVAQVVWVNWPHCQFYWQIWSITLWFYDFDSLITRLCSTKSCRCASL